MVLDARQPRQGLDRFLGAAHPGIADPFLLERQRRAVGPLAQSGVTGDHENPREGARLAHRGRGPQSLIDGFPRLLRTPEEQEVLAQQTRHRDGVLLLPEALVLGSRPAVILHRGLHLPESDLQQTPDPEGAASHPWIRQALDFTDEPLDRRQAAPVSVIHIVTTGQEVLRPERQRASGPAQRTARGGELRHSRLALPFVESLVAVAKIPRGPHQCAQPLGIFSRRVDHRDGVMDQTLAVQLGERVPQGPQDLKLVRGQILPPFGGGVPPTPEKLLLGELPRGLTVRADDRLDLFRVARESGLFEPRLLRLPGGQRRRLAEPGLALTGLDRPIGLPIQIEIVLPGRHRLGIQKQTLQGESPVESRFRQTAILARRPGGRLQGVEEIPRIVGPLRTDQIGRRQIAPGPGLVRGGSHLFFQPADGPVRLPGPLLAQEIPERVPPRLPLGRGLATTQRGPTCRLRRGALPRPLPWRATDRVGDQVLRPGIDPAGSIGGAVRQAGFHRAKTPRPRRGVLGMATREGAAGQTQRQRQRPRRLHRLLDEWARIDNTSGFQSDKLMVPEDPERRRGGWEHHRFRVRTLLMDGQRRAFSHLGKTAGLPSNEEDRWEGKTCQSIPKRCS